MVGSQNQTYNTQTFHFSSTHSNSLFFFGLASLLIEHTSISFHFLSFSLSIRAIIRHTHIYQMAHAYPQFSFIAEQKKYFYALLVFVWYFFVIVAFFFFCFLQVHLFRSIHLLGRVNGVRIREIGGKKPMVYERIRIENGRMAFEKRAWFTLAPNKL